MSLPNRFRNQGCFLDVNYQLPSLLLIVAKLASNLLLFWLSPSQVKKSKFREPGGSKKKKNDAVAAGTGEVVKAELVERPREYVVTLHFPEVKQASVVSYVAALGRTCC